MFIVVEQFSEDMVEEAVEVEAVKQVKMIEDLAEEAVAVVLDFLLVLVEQVECHNQEQMLVLLEDLLEIMQPKPQKELEEEEGITMAKQVVVEVEMVQITKKLLQKLVLIQSQKVIINHLVVEDWEEVMVLQ